MLFSLASSCSQISWKSGISVLPEFKVFDNLVLWSLKWDADTSYIGVSATCVCVAECPLVGGDSGDSPLMMVLSEGSCWGRGATDSNVLPWFSWSTWKDSSALMDKETLVRINKVSFVQAFLIRKTTFGCAVVQFDNISFDNLLDRYTLHWGFTTLALITYWYLVVYCTGG